jgi:hypothetical protein
MRTSITFAFLITCYCLPALGATAVVADVTSWDDYRIVYGEILSSTDLGDDTANIRLRVVATLAGRLDAPAEPIVACKIYYGGASETCVQKPPPAGSRCIATISDPVASAGDGSARRKQAVDCAITPFMPKSQYLVVVSGLDDPKVAETIRRLRELRSPLWPTSENLLPQNYDGGERKLWEDRSVVLAEVVLRTQSDRPVGHCPDRPRATLILDVKATIAGSLDAALDCRVPVRLAYDYPGSPIKTCPDAKSKIVVVLRRMSDDRLAVSEDYFAFMPDKSPIAVINAFDDPKAQEIVSRLRQLRQPVDNKGQ